MPIEKEWNALIVSSVTHHRVCLLNSLRQLGVNPFTVNTIRQAREMLSSLCFDFILCEENTTDGSYRELLSKVLDCYKETRFVLLLSATAWEEYSEANRLGAAAVLPCPLKQWDVNDTLRRVFEGQLIDQAKSATA